MQNQNALWLRLCCACVGKVSDCLSCWSGVEGKECGRTEYCGGRTGHLNRDPGSVQKAHSRAYTSTGAPSSTDPRSGNRLTRLFVGRKPLGGVQIANKEISSYDLMTRVRKQSAKRYTTFTCSLFFSGLKLKLKLCHNSLVWPAPSPHASYPKVLSWSNLPNAQTSKILSQTWLKQTCFYKKKGKKAWRRAVQIILLLRNLVYLW